MLKKSILAIALTVTLASVTSAFAAPKQDRWMGGYNSTVTEPANDSLFDRAKGDIY